MKDKRVCIGKVIAAHGIKGDVKVKSYTDNPSDIDKFGMVENADASAKYSIKVLGPAKDLLRVKISGVEDRNTAESLVGTLFYVYRSAFPKLGDDEYYLADLEGFNVCLNNRSQVIGKVVGFEDFGAGKIMEIRLNGQRDTEMLPFTKEYVPEINQEEEYVIVSSATMNYASDDYADFESEQKTEEQY